MNEIEKVKEKMRYYGLRTFKQDMRNSQAKWLYITNLIFCLNFNYNEKLH